MTWGCDAGGTSFRGTGASRLVLEVTSTGPEESPRALVLPALFVAVGEATLAAAGLASLRVVLSRGATYSTCTVLRLASRVVAEAAP